MAGTDGATGSDDDRSVHQEWVLADELEEIVVGPLWVVQAQFVVGRALAAQQVSNRNAHGLDQ